MKNDEKIYRDLLYRFTNKDRQNWTARPFNIMEQSAATNSHAIVIVPMNLSFIDRTEKVEKIIFSYKRLNAEYKIKTRDIKTAIDNHPVIELTSNEEGRCSACNGFGSVDYHFSHSRKDYEIESDCPVCEGEGVVIVESDKPTGIKVYDPSKVFKVLNSELHYERIKEVLDVAEAVSAEFVCLVSQDGRHKPSVFEIGAVTVIAAPLYTSETQTIIEDLI